MKRSPNRVQWSAKNIFITTNTSKKEFCAKAKPWRARGQNWPTIKVTIIPVIRQ